VNRPDPPCHPPKPQPLRALMNPQPRHNSSSAVVTEKKLVRNKHWNGPWGRRLDRWSRGEEGSCSSDESSTVLKGGGCHPKVTNGVWIALDLHLTMRCAQGHRHTHNRDQSNGSVARATSQRANELGVLPRPLLPKYTLQNVVSGNGCMPLVFKADSNMIKVVSWAHTTRRLAGAAL